MTHAVLRAPHWRPFLNAWKQRVWEMTGGVSIRMKIIGMVVTLSIFLGVVVSWQVRAAMEETLSTELRTRGFSVVSDLATRSADPILLNDTYALYQLLTDTTENHPDALYAFVLEPEGQVLVHTFGDAGFPVQLMDIVQTNPVEDRKGDITHFRFESNEGVVHDFAAPIFGGRAGVVHLGLTENRLHETINRVTKQIILTAALVALVGVAAAIALTWILTRPVLALVKTAQAVGGGDLQARAPHLADDEIGKLAQAFNQMITDLQASQKALKEKEAARTLLLEKLITAQEEERKRIARELHDGIGQALISLMVDMKMASQIDDVARLHEKNRELRQAAAETLEQVRLLSRQLRPSALDDLGLEAALTVFVDEFTQLHPDIRVDLHCELSDRLPPVVAITFYRIIQEAMINAARHSGGDMISVLVSQRGQRVRAIIEDNGRGFDVEAAQRSGRSVGIHAMTERAELLGGDIHIESSEEGVSVYVEAPLNQG
ncbi:MAG: HAMP domain-containing protein [Chloroflexi bacterium]|nr:HAMP domain-containing protein [Chloroflexota bacterium]